MWLKTTLFVYHTTFLLIRSEGAAGRQDEFLSGGRSMVDYSRPPVFWRRGNSFQNGTTLSSTLEHTPETELESSTQSSTTSSPSESVLPTTDSSLTDSALPTTISVSVTSSRGSEDGSQTNTAPYATQSPPSSSDMLSTAATTSAKTSGVELATSTSSPTTSTVWGSQESQQAPSDRFTSIVPQSLGETPSSASPSPPSTSKEDLELSTSDVGSSPSPVMTSDPALTIGIPVVPTPNEISEDSTRTTISVTADSQLVSPTPSQEAQPITTPLERPTFTTTSDSQGIIVSQMNTVAYQSTLLSSAIQVVPSPTFGEHLTPTTTNLNSIPSPIIENGSHSTLAASDNQTVIESSYSGLHSLPTTASLTWTDHQTLITTGPTIIPTGASTSSNVSEIENNLQIPNTTENTVLTNSTTSANNTRSNAFGIQPTMTINHNKTSVVLSPHLPKTFGHHSGWKNSSTEGNHESTRAFAGTALPSGFINSNRTQHGGSRTTLISSLRNATFGNFVYTNTTSATVTVVANITMPTNNPNSTTVLDETTYRATRTPWTRPTITSVPTETIVAPVPPPLNTPQTAGVAIGSVAGVLLAVVAAVFLARRYYGQRVAKRTSTGSIYPKMAYLYDPLSKGDWDGSSNYDGATAMMSGGANGFPTSNSTTTSLQHASSAPLAPPSIQRFSDPGNPFLNSGVITQERRDSTRNSLPTPVDAVTAFSAAVGGYALAAQTSSSSVGYSTSTSSQKLSMPSPTLSPLLKYQSMRHGHSRSCSQGSINSVRTEMTINGSVFYNTSCMETPLSPYRNHLNLSLASVKERPSSDPFAEPLEDDLYLPIDSTSETPHSVLVYAPPPTPRTPNKHQAHTASASESASSTTIGNSLPSRLHSYGRDSIASKASFASHSTVSLPELSTASYASESWTENSRSGWPSNNQSQHDLPISPMSPPPAPVHRGWEDIKRFSNESNVPSPLFTSPPLTFSPPPPTQAPFPAKKRSLIQLRRREPALAGPGHVMMSGAGQPLTVKIPFKYDPYSGFEGPRMSLLAKLNMMGNEERDDHIRSPGLLSITESLYSSDGFIHQNRSEHYAKPDANAKVVHIGH